MEIIEATIHRLQKEAHTQGEGTVELQHRDENLPVDETLTTVCKELLQLYNRSSDSSGILGKDRDLHVFPVRLNEYLADSLSFPQLCHATVGLIAHHMQDARFSSGGYALFLRYREPPNDFFMVAMLKLKPGAGIDEESLGLLPTLNIDLDLLNEAARVNLTRLASDDQPYLTFIKGRRKSEHVTKYFRDALACLNYTDSATQTRELVAACDDFVAQREDLKTEVEKQQEKLKARERLHDCLNANREEVTLATLAAAIHPVEPEEFVTFSQAVEAGERRYKFNARFKPDRRVTQNLRRIQGTMGSIRLSFDVQDVRTGTVDYDDNRDAVIINNPTEQLKKEILENRDEPAD